MKIFLKRVGTTLSPLSMYSITPLKGNLLTKFLLIFHRLLSNKPGLKRKSLIPYTNNELIQITIDRFVQPNSEILEIFRGYNKFPFLSIFIHGSWADNTRTAFSDLDDLIIINDENPISILKKIRAEYWLNKVEMRMNRIDPIQHHGHWIIYSSQLKNYDDSFMPLSVLENAIRLQGPTSIYGNINLELSQEGSIKNIRSCINGINLLHKKYIDNKINIFEMKGLIGNILLLPAFVNQANGNRLSKRDAIMSCRSMYSNEACVAIETCSSMRDNWNLALESKRFKNLKRIALLVRNPLFFRSISKKYSPLFPAEKFEKLNKHNVVFLVKESLNYANIKRS